MSNREEKEKFDILFSNFEKRKRNLKFISPVSRGEKEIWKKVLHFREEKEKGIFFSQVSRGEREFFLNLQFREEKEKSEILFPSSEKRKRNLEKGSPLSRREREMDIIFSRFERRKRIPTRLFEKFSLSPKLCQSYCDSQSFRESESFTLISFSVKIVILAACYA